MRALKLKHFAILSGLLLMMGDNTKQIVERWRHDAPFPIRYIRQENQGKHVAFNRGVQEAKGRLFLTLDSDDACVPEALERFKYYWELIPISERDQFSGVTALCINESGQIVGIKFPRDIFDSNSIELRFKYKVKGEKWGFQRTDILKKFPFPTMEGMKYIPASIVWRSIAHHYKTRYVNEALRIYFSPKRKSDQLTNYSVFKKSLGRAMWCRDALNEEIQWFTSAPVAFAWIAINYSRCSFHAGMGLDKQFNGLKNAWSKLLWMSALPFGFLSFILFDKKEKRLHRSSILER